MSADVGSKPIPKEFLCRRCNHCGDDLRQDGLVDCQLSEHPVVPVERREYGRFEHCPLRTGFEPLPSDKLRLLASYARRVKDRDGSEQMYARLDSAESVIRNDMRISARLRR
jgi:hypothetical protein